MESEHLIFSNSFGAITNKQIELNSITGLKKIPIDKINSIRLRRQKFIILAIGCFTVSIVLLVYLLANLRHIETSTVYFLTVSLILSLITGLLSLVGRNYILIQFKDKVTEPLKLHLFKIKEGRLFVEMAENVIR